MSARFTADHALDITRSRRDSFKKTMSIIRSTIDEQIKEAAMRGLQHVIVEVPRIVYGREDYDIVEMGSALVDQLHEDKYTVTGTYVKFTVRWGGRESFSRTPKKPNGVILRKPVINVPIPRSKVN